MKIVTIKEAVTFLVNHYSGMYPEHRFEKVSDCAESIMTHELPDTRFHYENGDWIKDEYCDRFIELIGIITAEWDRIEHENN